MLGAIIGDIVGSRFEKKPAPPPAFALFTPNCRFTDDTVLTIAVAEAIIEGISYEQKLREYYVKFPNCGYGRMFRAWATGESKEAYNSYGNGSAMRVSPVGYAFNNIDDVLREAQKSAECTHNHIEGIKGAQAVALAIFMIRMGAGKKEVKQAIEDRFGYMLNDILREEHVGFDVTCQLCVPQAITAFLLSDSFEDSIRRAVLVGGDTDTIACINGAIAQAYYRYIPKHILQETIRRLPYSFVKTIIRFNRRYMT
jgi:ADP-ribosylglycohydrolase